MQHTQEHKALLMNHRPFLLKGPIYEVVTVRMLPDAQLEPVQLLSRQVHRDEQLAYCQYVTDPTPQLPDHLKPQLEHALPSWPDQLELLL